MLAIKLLFVLPSLVVPLNLYSNVVRDHEKKLKEAPLEKPIETSKLKEYAKIFELKSAEKSQEDTQKRETPKKHKNISATEFKKILQIKSDADAPVFVTKEPKVNNNKSPIKSIESLTNAWLEKSRKSFVERKNNSRTTSLSAKKEVKQEIKVDPNSIANNKDLFDKVDFGTPPKTLIASDFIKPASLSEESQAEDHVIPSPTLILLNNSGVVQASSSKTAENINQKTQTKSQETPQEPTERKVERDLVKDKKLAKPSETTKNSDQPCLEACKAMVNKMKNDPRVVIQFRPGESLSFDLFARNGFRENSPEDISFSERHQFIKACEKGFVETPQITNQGDKNISVLFQKPELLTGSLKNEIEECSALFKDNKQGVSTFVNIPKPSESRDERARVQGGLNPSGETAPVRRFDPGHDWTKGGNKGAAIGADAKDSRWVDKGGGVTVLEVNKGNSTNTPPSTPASPATTPPTPSTPPASSPPTAATPAPAPAPTPSAPSPSPTSKS